jgi:YegS/Rv2252/BmrU family lipid kinase
VTGTRALFIVNRHSRSGREDLSAVVRLLEEHGFDVRARPVDRSGDVADAIREEADGVDVVILAGGDGTMNAAADALVECQLPLGILPTGTANDLARTLGIPVSVPEALEVIIEGHLRAIDLGRVNGKHFFNVASIGLSAELIRHHTAERKRRWWIFAYVFSIADAYRATVPFRALVRCNGRTVRLRAIQIAVGNGRHYGGGMTVSEHAAIDDEHLDIYVIKPISFWALIALFPKLRWGRMQGSEAISVMRGGEIEIRTRRPMPVNTDGEVTTSTPARFEVVPKVLAVFVPASEEEAGHAAH